MRPEDFRGREPRLEIEGYFAGRTRAWGIFQDRFGVLRRQFQVEIEGTVAGGETVLDERFRFDDGSEDRRIWRIRRTGPHSYEGRAGDVIGVARGELHGNVLTWRYAMDLPIRARRLRVRFDDRMFLGDARVLINRARVSKWGVTIGEVTLVFLREEDPASGEAPAPPAGAGAASPAAGR